MQKDSRRLLQPGVSTPIIRFKSCYHVEREEPSQVFLISEQKINLLSGEIYYKLCPLLKEGIYSLDEIVDYFYQKIAIEEVYYALNALEEDGFLEQYDPKISDEFAAFCQLFDVVPQKALEKLSTSKVYVSSGGEKVLEPLLKSLYLTPVSSPENADLSIQVVDHYLNQNLTDFAQKSRSPWMLLNPKGVKPWIGPLFKPGGIGCYECLKSHLKRNHIEESYVQTQIGRENHFTLSKGALEVSKGAIVHLAAVEIFKWFVLGKTKLEGKILSLDLNSMQIDEHYLTPLPYCLFCGKQKSASAAPLQLCSQPKNGYNDGGYRSTTPEHTLKKFAQHVSPILGIISTLSLQTVKENSILHVYGGGSNFALSNPERGRGQKGFRDVSGGKGKTEIQAKASCLSESIERYSGIFQGYEPRIKKSYHAIQADAIHPNFLLLYSEAQYQDREKINASAMSIHIIPSLFCEEEEVEWSPIWSLTEKKHKYVPTAYCYYKYPAGKNGMRGDSNGCAAGNTLEEAILQGFFELVERDSVAIWWYNRLVRPEVDLSTFNDPYFQQLVEEYRSMNREVWVLDLTTDLNIPSFVAISREMEKEEEDIIFGFGAHLDAKIAIARALAELNQFIFIIPSRKGNSIRNQGKHLVKEWLSTATLESQPYLKGSTEERAKVATDYSIQKTNDLLDDILFCQKIVEERGMELLVLDQTRPEIDLKVVKVMVPGLRHFWPRFAPGRLYDVPVQLGWLKEPKSEAEMNPIPMFL